MTQIEKFWKEFIETKDLGPNTKYLEAFHFEFNEKLANALLELVLIGQKQATSSSLASYEIEGERIPQVCDYSIVTDWDGNPHCVIETTKVTILPYDEITYDICKREGEDDTLKSWQRGHEQFFRNEGKELGYEFDKKMLVVFEDFEVVFRK